MQGASSSGNVDGTPRPAAQQVLRPLTADLDAIMGRGSHGRGDLADAPEMVAPQARTARAELRSCVVAAADVVDAPPNDEDASNKLLVAAGTVTSSSGPAPD